MAAAGSRARLALWRCASLGRAAWFPTPHRRDHTRTRIPYLFHARSGFSSTGETNSAESAKPAAATQDGKDEKKETREERQHRPLWHYAIVFGTPIAYVYSLYRARKRAADQAYEELVAATPREIKNIARKTLLSEDDALKLVEECRAHYGTSGTLSLDEFGPLVQKFGRGKLDYSWEPAWLLRMCPDSRGRIGVDDALVAASALVMGVLPAAKDEPAQSRSQSESEEAKPQEPTNEFVELDNTPKIRVFWRVADHSGHGSLSLQELTTLFDRLIRTGHMTTLRLPYLVQWFPPRFELRKPEDLARMYAADLAALRRQTVAGAAQQADEDFSGFTLSLEDFLRLTPSLQRAQLVNFWYLNHPRHSSFKLWRQRVAERARRKWAGMSNFGRSSSPEQQQAVKPVQ